MKRYFAFLLGLLISIAAYAQIDRPTYHTQSSDASYWLVSVIEYPDDAGLGELISPYRYGAESDNAATAPEQVVAYSEGGNLVVVSAQTATIAVYDMTGRRIVRFDGVSGIVRIPVQTGAYIVKASIDRQDYVLKVVVR